MGSILDHYATAAETDVGAPWRDRAACCRRACLMDDPALYVQALAVCWDCPVRVECRDWVLTLPDASDPEGVVGGMTFDQRKKTRRRMRWEANHPGPRAPARADRKRPLTTVVDLTREHACTQCRQTKPASEFNRDRSQTHGLSRRCRDCTKRASRARRARRKKENQ